MNTMFLGLLLSLVYGLLSCGILYFSGWKPEYQLFAVAYTTSFKTLVSLGLALGTALIVFRSQHLVPQAIEAAFSREQLEKTKYYLFRGRLYSKVRTIAFTSSFIVISFVIFTCCQFPLPAPAEDLMIIPACIQYALGVYIGRKLFYAGLMLLSLLDTKASRNLFKERELDEINIFVNIVSTLTIIFVYVHVLGYFEGPFVYQSVIGKGIKIFLLLPAIIATPVLLIFNFYPRIVLRKIYSESIDIEIKVLQKALQNEALSSFERRSYLIEFDKMSRDELRYRLGLTLSDLPIGITVLVMVLEPLLRN